jgi:hypothetical protein
VDIWQAVRPRAVGIDAWPDHPEGTALEGGHLRGPRRLGPADHVAAHPRGVGSYADLETPLVGAVEELIDFVTTG